AANTGTHAHLDAVSAYSGAAAPFTGAAVFMGPGSPLARRPGRREERSALSALGPDALDVAGHGLEVGRVQHQGAVGHPLDVAGLVEADVVRQLDGDLGRAHLLAVLLGEVAAEIHHLLLEGLVG